MTNSTLEFYKEESATEQMPIDKRLFRAAVLKDGLLVLEMHHALFDHWSSQFIFTDAISILRGQKPVSRAPFSYFVGYQQTKHDEAARRFWKIYLDNATPSILEVPLSEEEPLPRALASPLRNSPSMFCSTYGIALGTLLHAAWALTLSAQLNSSDILFVTAFPGRDADIKNILTPSGLILSTVPMRVRIDENLSVLAFIGAVQNNLWTLSKYAHSSLRNALVDGRLRADSFITIVNILVTKPAFPDDSPLVSVMTHADNFMQ